MIFFGTIFTVAISNGLYLTLVRGYLYEYYNVMSLVYVTFLMYKQTTLAHDNGQLDNSKQKWFANLYPSKI